MGLIRGHLRHRYSYLRPSIYVSGYPISIIKLALLLYSVYSPSTNIDRYYVTLIYKTITLRSKNYYFYSFCKNSLTETQLKPGLNTGAPKW
jgi:hypothetical protein